MIINKLKKQITVLIAAAILPSFSSCVHEKYINPFCNDVFQAEILPEQNVEKTPRDWLKEITGVVKRPPYYKYTTDTLHPSISAECAGIYDVKARKTLFSVNGDEQVAPASLTKMVTALVAVKYADPQDVFTVGNEQYSVMKGSSLCYIKIGQKLTLEQLLIGMLMPSGNDAAYTIAVNVAKKAANDPEMTISDALNYFNDLMNGYCEEIGAYDSHFVNPDGWDEDDHYSTANNLALFATKLLENDLLSDIVSHHKKRVVFVSGEDVTWTDSNKLLDPKSAYYRENAIGVKTGSTPDAGYCLIAAEKTNGRLYITVILGCDTRDDSYKDTITLLQETMCISE